MSAAMKKAVDETKEDMKKGEGLYLNALAGVLPFITLVPDAQEFEVAWFWERDEQ